MFYLCKTRTLFDLQLVKFGRSQIQRPSQNYTIKEEEVSLEETTPQTPGLSSSLATPEGLHEKIICEFEHFLSIIIF